MREPRDRLQDILEAISQIELEQAKGRAAFDHNPLVQVWMVPTSAAWRMIDRISKKWPADAQPGRRRAVAGPFEP